VNNLGRSAFQDAPERQNSNSYENYTMSIFQTRDTVVQHDTGQICLVYYSLESGDLEKCPRGSLRSRTCSWRTLKTPWPDLWHPSLLFQWIMR